MPDPGNNRMNKKLHASVLAGVFAFLVAGPAARAQMAVEDSLNTLWQTLNNSELVSQVKQATQAVAELQQQYQQLLQVENTLAHPTSVMGVVTGLESELDVHPLPSGLESVLGMANGSNLNVAGLGSLANRFLNQNNTYLPPSAGSGDFNATWLSSRANSTAGLQAMVARLMHSSQDRLDRLPALQAEIDAQPDVQAMSAINARLASEQVVVGAQAAQVAQIQALANLQAQADAQQSEQRDRQNADGLFNATRALP